MAEVKNAFIRSKMNLDLDARLVPQGEYRQGFNIQVSKSEGDDVGALENVLGNDVLPNGDFQALNPSFTGLQVIGHVANPANDTVYLFLTNNIDSAYQSDASTKNHFIYAYNILTQTPTKLVEGLFLNFSTLNPIYGVNIVENLLFWTDNRNQPRKININKSLGYYTTEDHISVAKFAPYEAITLYQQSTTTGAVGQYECTMKDVVSDNLPDGTTANPYKNNTYAGDPDYLEDKFVRFSYRFKFEDNEYSSLAPFTQECFIPKQDGYFITSGTAGTSDYINNEEATYRSTVVSFMENKVNEITLYIPLPLNIGTATPMTGATLYNDLKVTEIDIVYKESDAQAVQVVDTLLVNGDFQSKYPGSAINYIYQSLKPYKTLPEADLIRVYDKVPVKALSQEVSGNRVIYGNFQDKHTPLFENLSGQLTPTLDYKLGAFDKSNFVVAPSNENPTQDTTSIIEYPNSTLKQNRNYQAGIVLSDRYGRSSTVLLSNFVDESTVQGSSSFTASTHYHPYRSELDTSVVSWPGDALKILFNSPISTPSPIPAGSGIPGLYFDTGAGYNILGWYSYKVVIKQFEQEYYNVYLPGILNGPPNGVTTNDPAGTVGFITLINDNVNKVPRDLSEVGPEQKQFRSSVQLFGRVTPAPAPPITYNKPFYPGIQSSTVITIADEDDLFGTSTGSGIPTDLPNIYDSLSNPLVGRVSQIDASNPIGSTGTAGTYDFYLGVFETSPTQSRLDIYYETSTSGLISTLNSAINTNTNTVTGAVGDTAVGFNENQTHSGGNVNITGAWAPVDALSVGEAVDQDLPANQLTATIASVTSRDSADGPSVQRSTSLFAILPVDPDPGFSPYSPTEKRSWYRYQIQSTQDFVYGENAAIKHNYDITVTFTNTSGESTGSVGFPVPLANTSPIFEKYTPSNGPDVTLQGSAVSPPGTLPTNFVLQLTQGQTGTLATFSGLNGTAKTGLNDDGEESNQEVLNWSITSPANQTIFSINASGALSTTEDLTGPYPITVTLTDEGGPTDATDFAFTLLFGNEPLNTEFGRTSGSSVGGGGQSGALYFVNTLTNAAGSGPLPGISSGSNDIRVPYPNLQLSNDVYALSNDNGNQRIILPAPDCSGFEFVNSNQNAMALQQGGSSAGLSQANAGLTQGTAFIGVQIEFTQQTASTNGFSEDNYPFLMFPIYLQYRADPSHVWTNATDIEGNLVKFGGSQINQFTNFPDSGDVAGTGIINKVSNPQFFSSQGVNTYPNGFNSDIKIEDCLEVSNQVRYNNSNVTQNTIARKTFVIGKSPYANISDKFGEYRLIVRYPWGDKSSNSANPGATNPIVVGYSSIECPAAGFGPQGSGRAGGMVSATAFFDDFYYPSIYGGSNAYSYKYRVSTSARNTPELAAGSAQTTPLWAREWHMKYVTKFYTDADLSIEWQPSPGWYLYMPVDNNGIPARYGTDYSNTNSSVYPSMSQNNFRRWVAYFDGTGLKSLANSTTPSVPMKYQPW